MNRANQFSPKKQVAPQNRVASLNPIKLLAALIASSLLVASAAMAQPSALGGFYGQVGAGFGSTSLSATGGTYNDGSGNGYTINANRSSAFTGAIGIGAYFAVESYFLLGFGAEYSSLVSSHANGTVQVPAQDLSSSGAYSLKHSYNLFLSPAIALTKDSLTYAKFGFTGANFAFGTGSPYATNLNTTGYALRSGPVPLNSIPQFEPLSI